MKIDKEELLRRLNISEQHNSDIPAWVLKTIEKMPDADRDCENCANHLDGGCTKWECEYKPWDAMPLPEGEQNELQIDR